MPLPITTPTTIEPAYEASSFKELLNDFINDHPNLFVTLTNHPIRFSDFAPGVAVTIVHNGSRQTITT